MNIDGKSMYTTSEDQKLQRDPLDAFRICHPIHEEFVVRDKGAQELQKLKENKMGAFNTKSPLFHALSLLEYEKGVLMSVGVEEEYRPFVLRMSLQLQKEFICKTESEKGLAELVAINYVRILMLQRRVNSYLELGTMSDLGCRHFAILSKELDRAQRQYVTTLQLLETIHKPPLQVSIHTNVANLAQNQLIQENHVIESK